MTENENIPEFALQPAKSEKIKQEQIDDGFDPTPYDRLLAKEPSEQDEVIEVRQILEKNKETEETKEVETVAETEIVGEPELEPEAVPAAVPVAEPVSVAETDVIEFIAPKETETALPASAVKITPMSNSVVYSDLKLTTVVQQAETKIYVEEDILVPDVQPDLVSILSMDGNPVISGRELQTGQEESLRVTGEVALQTIYLPEQKNDGEPLAIIQSRLPFKTDWQISASPISHLSITPIIEKVDYTVINERKFRTKITLRLALKECAEKDVQIFEGMNGENLQLLKQKVKLSHIALRKEDTVDISETLTQKDGSLRPEKILKSHINIIENHKQITSEKMVINGLICCNILYMGQGEKDGEDYSEPALLQTKTDFTQFILIDKKENIAGSQVTFNGGDLTLAIKEEDDGPQFQLSGTIQTEIELYENIEKEMVSDLYHNLNDTTYDVTEKTAYTIMGNGSTEISAREIFYIPEKNGQAAKVIYISGRIKDNTATAEKGRALIEGTLEGQLLCLAEEDNRPFTISQEIPFRGSIEIPSAAGQMRADTKISVKDLWFDKINGKQIEVNASLLADASIIEDCPLKLIKNPCFVESEHASRPASMIIYITKKGDTLWKIAKKYKISREMIAEINKLEENQKIAEGMRLLIVK